MIYQVVSSWCHFWIQLLQKRSKPITQYQTILFVQLIDNKYTYARKPHKINTLRKTTDSDL